MGLRGDIDIMRDEGNQEDFNYYINITKNPLQLQGSKREFNFDST
jgi:hypothetical protein